MTTTQNEELFRRYMAEQADAQTRQLRRIADNTAATRVAAIVLLVLVGLNLLIGAFLGAVS
ncbi:hypothetical protein GCM10027451_11130 [Geodermatophilus aquaeductus]|uniref:Uncharacterized protein n=1 Tax=Geodermatophilus aquaeductus TaxID=1564161 RepID=A0A521DRU4_9ACTN|nr:hypothetical protein [Geodermatophilus aquaeductus]SMO74295.1 hypothetical protein SAMN06273567_103472 [Geodermatophilus aquaeductus]